MIYSIAGSETTATALSCITYYLQKNPTILQKLQKEIREAFTSYDQINNNSTTPLRYMNAVILEGMRMYPPLPFPLPRVVPQGGTVIDGNFVPEGVSIYCTRTSQDTSQTNILCSLDCGLYKSFCGLHVATELPRPMEV